jgi:hypothetical protein
VICNASHRGCAWCGDPLDGRRRDAATCSVRCRVARWRHAHGCGHSRDYQLLDAALKAAEQLPALIVAQRRAAGLDTCAACGGSMVGKAIHAVVCSTRCRVARHRARRRPAGLPSPERWSRDEQEAYLVDGRMPGTPAQPLAR